MAASIRALWFRLQRQRSMSALTPPPTLPVKTLCRSPLHCRAISVAATPPVATTVHVRDSIEVTDVENKIFDRLLATQHHFGLQNQLRVAGGWVRDKLLGKDCNDIEIALENMLGGEFVHKVGQYLLFVGEEIQLETAVNPTYSEQLKHSETARMRICDMWIDFVDLRCEDNNNYGNSHIPTQVAHRRKFGCTAEKVAYNRDLTINSLFYNINTRSVEDYTKRGRDDLKFGRIVTPLPAKDSFMNDPIRILRAIRFGAQFDFILDEELKKAAASWTVRVRLHTIGADRMRTEFDLMISGKQPVKAMTCLCDLRLFDTIFWPPEFCEPELPEGYDRLCLSYLDATWKLIQLIGASFLNEEQRRLCLYAAMFLPLRETRYKDNYGEQKPAVEYILQESLQLKDKDVLTVVNIHKEAERFLYLIPYLAPKTSILFDDIVSGKENDVLIEECQDIPDYTPNVRELTAFIITNIREFWRVSLLLSIMVQGIDCTGDATHLRNLDKLRDTFVAIESAIVELGLERAWEDQPFIVNSALYVDIFKHKLAGARFQYWIRNLASRNSE